MEAGRYECLCPAHWNGVDCSSYDTTFSGGIGRKDEEALQVAEALQQPSR